MFPASSHESDAQPLVIHAALQLQGTVTVENETKHVQEPSTQATENESKQASDGTPQRDSCTVEGSEPLTQGLAPNEDSAVSQVTPGEVKIAKEIQTANRYFDLKDINYKWHANVAAVIHDESSDRGPNRGMHAALAILCELWNMEAPNCPAWQEVKNELKVGLIKETMDCGTTSVSMGLAQKYFDLPNAKSYVAFLNCGNGGVKYQLYRRKKNIIAAKKSSKPAQEKKQEEKETAERKLAKFAELECGEYKPETPVKVEDLVKALVTEFSSAWKRRDSSKVDIFAFVTGAFRNHFERGSNDDERRAMNEMLGGIFNNIAAQPVSVLLGPTVFGEVSYLIPENLEAAMECLGARLMYKQVQEISPGDVELVPIMSIGIGQNSTQLCLFHNGKMYPLEFPGCAMDHPDCIHVGELVVKHYLANKDELDHLIGAIRECRDAGKCPTLALKSGCLLAFTRPGPVCDALKKTLLAPAPTPCADAAIITIRAGRPESRELKELQVPVNYSVSQLCVLAAKLYRNGSQVPVQFVMAEDLGRSQEIEKVTSDLHGRTIFFRGLYDTKYSGVRIKNAGREITFESLLNEVPSGWKVRSPRSTELKYPCIPFSWILDKWHLVKDVKNAEPGRKRGTHAGLVALKDLLLMNWVAWADHCKHMYVGIVKSTFDCGNSSVSMGLATIFLTDPKINTTGSKLVAFLNCGTGGIKFQLYTNYPQNECPKDQQSRVALIAEFKPGKGKFSSLVLESRFGFTPEAKEPTTVEELRVWIKNELRKTPWNLPSWPAPKVPVFAFITGLLRDHWENSRPSVVSHALQKIVHQVFQDDEFPVQPVSKILYPETSEHYFISREDEGKMELYALRRMYFQLKPGLDPVAAMSIEISSSRFTMVSSDGDPGYTDYKNYKKVQDFAGMKEEAVVEMGSEMVKTFSQPEHMTEELKQLLQVVGDSWRNGRLPMIALKAGCLLMIDEEKEVWERLVKRPPFSEEIDSVRLNRRARVAPIVGKDKNCTPITPEPDCILSSSISSRIFLMANIEFKEDALQRAVRLPITIARLCTEAAVALNQRSTSFLFVFLSENDHLVELKGSDDGILNAHDFPQVEGPLTLYFSKEPQDHAVPPPQMVEMFARAREIYPDREFWFKDVVAQFGHITEFKKLQAWDNATRRETKLEKFLERSIRLPSDRYACEPPVIGPVDSLRPGAAIISLKQQLPLGQYPGPQCTFLEAVLVQLHQLGIPAVPFAVPTGSIAACCALVLTSYPDLTIHVVNSGFPTRFGRGNRHMWLLKFEDSDFWAPLWSPHPLKNRGLILRLRPALDMIECTDLEIIKLFADDWMEIASFPVQGFELPLPQQVQEKIFELVANYIQEAFYASTTHIVVPMTLVWCSLPQWDRFMQFDFDVALGWNSDPNYKTTICEAFGYILVDLWANNYTHLYWIWATGIQTERGLLNEVVQWRDRWLTFADVLKANMKPERNVQLNRDVMRIAAALKQVIDVLTLACRPAPSSDISS